jgi:hypothetical protein
MASKKSAGVAPLGHEPFSKVKLEGPRRHHDYHGDKASVPGKGEGMAVPNKHYEIHYNMHKPSENMVLTEGADFVPKCPQDRKTTHLKVNKTDH